MRLVAISDTHNDHHQMLEDLPDGDVLIHAGDFTIYGREAECKTFLDWFASQPHKHKILVAGNHDWLFEKDPISALKLVPDVVTYLNDNGTTIDGKKFWGSPVQPRFHDWAFNRSSAQLEAHWALIPTDTDVLITHSPPHGILDEAARGGNCGSESLRREVMGRIKPEVHIFGHIHESYGKTQIHDTYYVNASICDSMYQPVNAPIVMDI